MSSIAGWGRDRTLWWVESTSAVAHLLSSLEHLVTEADRAPGGLNDWAVLRDWEQPSSRARAAVLDLVSSRTATRALHVLRAAAAAALLGPARSGTPRLLADVLLAGSWVALYPRHRPSADGADAASLLVQVASAVARTGGGRPARVDACLWFVAAQGALAYSASGWAKVAGPRWRRGTALPGILRTHTFGHPRVHRLVERHPRAALAASHVAVGIECAFPLALVGPRAVSRGLVAAMLSFHVANAVTMGLNRFVPAFGATYWAVLYVGGPRRRVAGGRPQVRDDSFPAAVAVAGALSAAGLHLAARRRRRAVARGLAGEHGVPLASGSVVRVRSCGEHGGDLPVLVLVHGLGAPVETWEWLARDLARSCTVVTVRRPGYGGSTGPAGRPAAVEDLVEIVRAQPQERGVVLVGHREGALLAAAAAAATRVDGVVMIGPVPVGRPGASGDLQTRVTVSLLRLGLGPLMREPDWVSRLPADVRPAVLRQCRDPGLWRAVGQDGEALAAVGPDGGPDGAGRVEQEPGSLLVLAPEAPAHHGPPGASTVTVPHADTFEVLLDREAAGLTAEVVAGFARDVALRLRSRRPVTGPLADPAARAGG